MNVGDFYILQNLDIDADESRKLARQKSTGKLCQLLFLHRPGLDIEKVREAHQLLLSQPSEHILPYLFLQQQEQQLVVAIEHQSGEFLERFLYREHHLEESIALELIFQIAKGLFAAQKLGVLHGALSPSCIFIQELRCKVTGFLLPDKEEPLFYKAPEFFKEPSTPLEVCHDLYSLGILWYQLLTGIPPYHGANAQELYRSKKKVLVEHERVPADVMVILQKMLAPVSSQRYLSYSEFFARLVSVRNRLIQREEAKVQESKNALKKDEDDLLLLPPEERIQRYMTRLEQARSSEQQVTRKTIRRRRVLLPFFLFTGAVGFLALILIILPWLLKSQDTDLFELVDVTEKAGIQPEEEAALRREEQSKKAFQEAEEKYLLQENLSEGIVLFTEVARKFQDTHAGQEAQSRVQGFLKRLREKENEEYQKAYKRSQEKQSQERFQEAIEALEFFISAFPQSERKEDLFNQIQEIQRQAQQAFLRQKELARQFVHQKNYREARQIFQKVIDTYGIKTIIDVAMQEIEQIDRVEYNLALSSNAKTQEEQERRNLAVLQLTIKKYHPYLLGQDFSRYQKLLEGLERQFKTPHCRQYLQDLLMVTMLFENMVKYILILNQEYAQQRQGRGYSLQEICNSDRKGYLSPRSTYRDLMVQFESGRETRLSWSQLSKEELFELFQNIMDKHQGKQKVEKGSVKWFEYRLLGMGVLALVHQDPTKANDYFQKALVNSDRSIKEYVKRLQLFKFP